MYAHKSELHTKKDQAEAALYAINTALEVLQSATLPAPPEYVILRATSLKACKRYSEAYECLEQLLKQLPKLQEEEPNSGFTVNKEELRSMLRTLKKLLLEEKVVFKKVVRVCNANNNSTGQQPYASYKLSGNCKIENSPVVGRHFIASGDISGGEVLLTERPYSTVLSREHAMKRCSFCFGKLDYKLYPCADCTEVLYCDPKCGKLFNLLQNTKY